MRIKSIKRIPKPEVTYNLHIRDDHNYFANGVLAANCHTSKANVLKSLLTGPLAHVPIRWGMTGTVPKEKHEFYSLLSSIGPVMGEVRAKDLQDKNVLASCEIEVLQLQDGADVFDSYQSEYTFLVTDEDRLRCIAAIIQSLEGNTLVLVDRLSTLEALNGFIPDSNVVSGSTKLKDRKVEFKTINEADNAILLATYGVAAVGLNIPRINNLVGIEFGKSFVRTIQSIGRILRKAHDKDSAKVYDICSSHKFSKRHLTERKKYYRDAEYPFKITKLDY